MTNQGGSFATDVRNLAIPFGLLLAERGLHGIISKKIYGSKKPKDSQKKSQKNKKGGEQQISQELLREFDNVTKQLEDLFKTIQ